MAPYHEPTIPGLSFHGFLPGHNQHPGQQNLAPNQSLPYSSQTSPSQTSYNPYPHQSQQQNFLPQNASPSQYHVNRAQKKQNTQQVQKTQTTQDSLPSDQEMEDGEVSDTDAYEPALAPKEYEPEPEPGPSTVHPTQFNLGQKHQQKTQNGSPNLPSQRKQHKQKQPPTSTPSNPQSHGRPNFSSVAEAQTSAQAAILRLWPMGVRYEDYLAEGIDGLVVQRLFHALGLDTSAPSKAHKTDTKADAKKETPETKALPPKGQDTNSKGAKNAMVEERKDRIARLLAAKQGKGQTSEASPSDPPGHKIDPSATTPIAKGVDAKTRNDLPEPPSKDVVSNKADLIRQKMEALERKQAERRAAAQQLASAKETSPVRRDSTAMEIDGVVGLPQSSLPLLPLASQSSQLPRSLPATNSAQSPSAILPKQTSLPTQPASQPVISSLSAAASLPPRPPVTRYSAGNQAHPVEDRKRPAMSEAMLEAKRRAFGRKTSHQLPIFSIAPDSSDSEEDQPQSTSVANAMVANENKSVANGMASASVANAAAPVNTTATVDAAPSEAAGSVGEEDGHLAQSMDARIKEKVARLLAVKSEAIRLQREIAEAQRAKEQLEARDNLRAGNPGQESSTGRTPNVGRDSSAGHDSSSGNDLTVNHVSNGTTDTNETRDGDARDADDVPVGSADTARTSDHHDGCSTDGRSDGRTADTSDARAGTPTGSTGPIDAITYTKDDDVPSAPLDLDSSMVGSSLVSPSQTGESLEKSLSPRPEDASQNLRPDVTSLDNPSNTLSSPSDGYAASESLSTRSVAGTEYPPDSLDSRSSIQPAVAPAVEEESDSDSDVAMQIDSGVSSSEGSDRDSDSDSSNSSESSDGSLSSSDDESGDAVRMDDAAVDSTAPDTADAAAAAHTSYGDVVNQAADSMPADKSSETDLDALDIYDSTIDVNNAKDSIVGTEDHHADIENMADKELDVKSDILDDEEDDIYEPDMGLEPDMDSMASNVDHLPNVDSLESSVKQNLGFPGSARSDEDTDMGGQPSTNPPVHPNTPSVHPPIPESIPESVGVGNPCESASVSDDLYDTPEDKDHPASSSDMEGFVDALETSTHSQVTGDVLDDELMDVDRGLPELQRLDNHDQGQRFQSHGPDQGQGDRESVSDTESLYQIHPDTVRSLPAGADYAHVVYPAETTQSPSDQGSSVRDPSFQGPSDVMQGQSPDSIYDSDSNSSVDLSQARHSADKQDDDQIENQPTQIDMDVDDVEVVDDVDVHDLDDDRETEADLFRVKTDHGKEAHGETHRSTDHKYESLFTGLSVFRYHPSFLSAVGPSGLRSPTYSHTLDPDIPLCPDRLMDRACPRAPDCQYQHLDNLPLSADQVLLQLGHPGRLEGPRKQRYVAGLRGLLGRLKQAQIRDFEPICQQIIAYRREFLGDPSHIWLLDDNIRL